MHRRARLLSLACLFSVSLTACDKDQPAPQPAATPTPPPPTLATTPIAAPADLCANTSARAWEVLAPNAQVVAETRGACLGKDPAGWHFVSQLQDVGAAAPTYEMHLWLSDGGKPRVAEMRTGLATSVYEWRDQDLRVSLYGDTHVLEGGAQVWVLPVHAVYLRELMLRVGAGLVGNGARQVGLAPERGDVIELELAFEGFGADARATSRAGTFGLRGDSLGAVQITNVVAATGAQVYRPKTESSLAPHLPESPRPTYTLGEGLEVKPVKVPAGKPSQPELAGELVMAKAEAAGKRPAVLFVSGSGPQERHGFVPNTSIDVGSHEIQDALARAGFVVLRIDDRGVGESAMGDTVTPGYLAFVDDARRSLKFLADHPDVDPSKLIVVGHSEGALTAAMLGNEKFGKKRKRPAGVVLMAAMGRNLREVIYTQIRRDYEADPSRAEMAVKEAQKIHDAVMNDGALPAATENVRVYLKEMFQQEPAAVLAKLKVPMLALQGGKDFQTDPQLDFGPVAAAAAKGAKGSASQLFPGVDLLFKPEPGRSTPGHYEDLTRRVSPEVSDAVVRWASTRVGMRSGEPTK